MGVLPVLILLATHMSLNQCYILHLETQFCLQVLRSNILTTSNSITRFGPFWLQMLDTMECRHWYQLSTCTEEHNSSTTLVELASMKVCTVIARGLHNHMAWVTSIKIGHTHRGALTTIFAAGVQKLPSINRNRALPFSSKLSSSPVPPTRVGNKAATDAL